MSNATPHPIPLPSGERGRVRGIEFCISVIGNYLSFGAWDLVLAVYLPPNFISLSAVYIGPDGFKSLLNRITRST